MVRICATGSAITPAFLNVLLLKTDLHWEMHPAQLASLENMAFYAKFTLQQEMDPPKEVIPETTYTLRGLPVLVDKRLDPGWISLMLGREELARIDSLAIPVGF